jgi:hypothetical protein
MSLLPLTATEGFAQPVWISPWHVQTHDLLPGLLAILRLSDQSVANVINPGFLRTHRDKVWETGISV